MVTSAFITLWGQRVGAVSWNSETRLGAFQYEKEFLVSGLDLSPLLMPLEKGDVIYEFQENRNLSTFKGLPGLLADILPDKYGNALINTWLLRNGRSTNSLNPVELLCFIGKRGMGALEFSPEEPKASSGSTKIEMNELVQIAEQILMGKKDFETDLTHEEEKALLDILKIGSSAGGARAKALIAYNEKTGEVRSGQTNALNGFEHWMIKFDGVTDTQFGASHGYGRVEMAYYLMALDAGIHMMESRILEENGRAHFMTKRFDRVGGKEKIHIQTFCAINHFDFNEVMLYSYEELFETMRMLNLSYPEAQEMYRRMVFNVLSRNCDDHTKNFSFMMNQKGEWSLSPAYDVCHAYRPDSQWVSQHALSINGKRKNITRDDLLEVGKLMNIKRANDLIDEVKNSCAKWMFFADTAQVEPRLRDAIAATHVLI
ncbi:MAG: type II toxin-antitoxin system HipA family toxin [Crocinitomix sp.]|jgi:serine/threonine-protein kinase HipA|nr:type II toxin-antitoxin system HipA family toxin [Crocinitomix sp.]